MMSPADDRATHPEGKAFNSFFTRLLLQATKSSFERDILCRRKNELWETWKLTAIEYDERNDGC